jgi:N-acetylneuraminic acid mutarotase
LLFVLVLVVSCLIVVKPAFSSSAVTAENTWTPKAPMQQARGNLAVAVVNGKIYAIGGKAENGIVGTNEEYDPTTDTWTIKTPMPTPRDSFGIAVYQNKIYCIGGLIEVNQHYRYASSEANEVYDPATDTWTTKTSMPTPKLGLQANVVNGKIYLIGGDIADNSGGFDVISLNEVYDPATDSWTTKTPLPNTTSYYASTVVDDKVYIMGGLSSSPQSNLNNIYDPKTDTWSQGALMPLGLRYGAAGATIGVNAPKRIYCFSADQDWNGTQVYDPENDSWTLGDTLPTSRLGLAVAVVDDKLYAIGGYTTYSSDMFSWLRDGPSIICYATVEEYTPFGYGTIPPKVSVVSPETKTYNETDVSLVFTLNKPATWAGYSMDGHENFTVAGNVTLTGLSSVSHEITVYANDTLGNMGASPTISFNVELPFPTALVAVASIASAGLIAVGLVVYFKKRKR